MVRRGYRVVISGCRDKILPSRTFQMFTTGSGHVVYWTADLECQFTGQNKELCHHIGRRVTLDRAVRSNECRSVGYVHILKLKTYVYATCTVVTIGQLIIFSNSKSYYYFFLELFERVSETYSNYFRAFKLWKNKSIWKCITIVNNKNDVDTWAFILYSSVND